MVGPECSLLRAPQPYEKKPTSSVLAWGLFPLCPALGGSGGGQSPLHPHPVPPTLLQGPEAGRGHRGAGRTLILPLPPSGLPAPPAPGWKSDTRGPSAALLSSCPWRPLAQRLWSSDCSGLNGQAWCPCQVHHCEGPDTCLAGRRPCLAERSHTPASQDGAGGQAPAAPCRVEHLRHPSRHPARVCLPPPPPPPPLYSSLCLSAPWEHSLGWGGGSQ